MAKKSQAELDFQLKAKRVDRNGNVLIQLIRWGTLLGCIYVVGSAIKVFAGQHTFADVGFKFIADTKIFVSEGVLALFGLSGVGYGLRQRKLRRDTIETLGPRAKDRELSVDPHRSSSRLTSRGTTPREKK
jgi:hypothetical protein